MRWQTLVLLILATGFTATAQEDNQRRRAMGGMHSMVRHQYAMRVGIPDKYQANTNPLAVTESTLTNGKRVYVENCSICHGEFGQGDGPAGEALNPRPSNIQRLPRMPMMSSDAYLYWTVAEGGVPIQTGMPAFTQTLSAKDIWSVILYIRQGF